MRRTAVALALLIVPVLAFSGCAPTPPPATGDPKPSSTPLFANEEEALKAATEAYAAYVEVSDQILMDGGKDPGRLTSVATGDQLKENLKGYTRARDEGLHSTGGTNFDRLRVQQIGTVRESAVVVYLCEDLSLVDVLDASGSSVVAPSRPDKAGYEVSFSFGSTVPPVLKVASKTPWSEYTC